MSLFTPVSVPCPKCETPMSMDAVGSVNADRRPDLRDEILTRDFQRETCSNCGTTFRLAPEFTYLDIARGLWIATLPYPSLGTWPEACARAMETFDAAYGAAAGQTGQEIGAGLTRRVVFGWSAVKEKIEVLEDGLDDVALELTKIAIVRGGGGGTAFGDGVELRFLGFQDDQMLFHWISGMDEEVKGKLALPRAMYDDIAADRSPWGEMGDRVAEPPFVDMQKLLYAADEAAA